LLDIPSSSPSVISLTSSDPAIKVPATVTIPAEQVSQTFSFSIGSTFNTNHVLSITGQMGTTSATAYDTVVASGAEGFQASLGIGGYSKVNMAAGQSVSNLQVSVTSVNGYATTMTMQCLGLPAQVSCQFTPASLPLRAADFVNASWVLSVPTGTKQGKYSGTVEVTDGMITQDLPFKLNVGDFSMSIATPTQQAQSTGGAGFTMTLTSIFDYDEQYVNFSCSGLPQGASCPSTNFTSLPTPSGTSYTFFVTTQSVPFGNYPFTITGTSAPLTHSVNATLQVTDFGASVTPTSATISAGGSATFQVTITSLNGFSGPVSLSLSGQLSAVGSSFSPTYPTVPANGTVTSTLTLSDSALACANCTAIHSSAVPSALVVVSLLLPMGALCIPGRSRRRCLSLLSLFLALCLIGSCGGGGASSSGGGGGGGGTSYSILVQVTSGNETKTAGTITLTEN